MKAILRFVAALSSAVIALPATAALNVFACEPEWGALAQELGGDKVSVYTATTALQDPHRIEARPSLIARIRSSALLICSGSELELGDDRWLLNPGSVGQPRDGDPRAAWLLLDLDARSARFHRVPYAIERTRAEIRERGLPEPLGARLERGE